jgi:hypothetical protein
VATARSRWCHCGLVHATRPAVATKSPTAQYTSRHFKFSCSSRRHRIWCPYDAVCGMGDADSRLKMAENGWATRVSVVWRPARPSDGPYEATKRWGRLVTLSSASIDLPAPFEAVQSALTGCPSASRRKPRRHVQRRQAVNEQYPSDDGRVIRSIFNWEHPRFLWK